MHGVIYADRLDPAAIFTRDDLEFISALASQTAVAALAHGHFELNRQPPVTVRNRVQPVEIFEVDWRGDAA